MDELECASMATIRLAKAADVYDVAGERWHVSVVAGGLGEARAALDEAEAEYESALKGYREAVANG